MTDIDNINEILLSTCLPLQYNVQRVVHCIARVLSQCNYKARIVSGFRAFLSCKSLLAASLKPGKKPIKCGSPSGYSPVFKQFCHSLFIISSRGHIMS